MVTSRSSDHDDSSALFPSTTCATRTADIGWLAWTSAPSPLARPRSPELTAAIHDHSDAENYRVALARALTFELTHR